MKCLFYLLASAGILFCAAGCSNYPSLTESQRNTIAAVRSRDAAGDFSNAKELRFHDPLNGKTPLIYTVTDRSFNKFQQILSAGGSAKLLEMKDQKGMTALQYAVELPDPAYLKALIAAKADVNTRDKYGKTPLMNACRLGNVEYFELLIAAGADPSAKDDQGRTIAMFAATAPNNSVALLKKIRALNPEEDAYLAFGDNAQCPLTCAINAKNREAVELLLEATCPQDLSKATNAQVVYALLAMKHAIKAKDYNFVKAMIRRRIPLNRDLTLAYKTLKRMQLKNWYRTFANAGIISDGKLPLTWAAECDDVDMIELLLAAGADPFCKDHLGAYPIEYTRKAGPHNELKRAMRKAGGK